MGQKITADNVRKAYEENVPYKTELELPDQALLELAAKMANFLLGQKQTLDSMEVHGGVLYIRIKPADITIVIDGFDSGLGDGFQFRLRALFMADARQHGESVTETMKYFNKELERLNCVEVAATRENAEGFPVEKRMTMLLGISKTFFFWHSSRSRDKRWLVETLAGILWSRP